MLSLGVLFNPILLFLGICGIIYLYLKRQYSYWPGKGVPSKKPHLIFGNMENLVRSKVSVADGLRDLYNDFKGEPFAGFWEFFYPKVLLRDPELVRTIFIKDFTAWMDRGFTANEDVEPLSAHLANLTGKRWKTVRNKLTPTFSSGKLKQMFHLLAECADSFELFLKDAAQSGKPVDVKEMSAKFTTDVIGSCVFGIQMNSMSDEDAEFRRMGRKITDNTPLGRVVEVIQITAPKLFKFLKLRMLPKESEEFFMNVFRDTVEYREKNNIQRHDFIDLLRKLKNEKDNDPHSEEVVFDTKLLTAQAFVFFGAGFETSSTAISYAMHELAVNPDVQQRLRDEIHATKAKHNGEITFDILKDMKYLDMVFSETLRKYPPIPAISRECVKPYTMPDTDVDIPVGMIAMIPIYGIHHDPEYYPEPEKFIPERFTEEAKEARHPFAYMPFGGGPRICIGMRFAELQTKMGLVKVLDKFKVSLCKESQHPLKIDRHARFMSPEKGIILRITAL